MKSYSLRSGLRISRTRDDARCNLHAIIGNRRSQSRKLKGSDADLLTHGNSANRNFRPPAYRLSQPTSLAGQLNSCLLPKAKGSNVFIEPVFAQTQRNFNSAHVA